LKDRVRQHPIEEDDRDVALPGGAWRQEALEAGVVCGFAYDLARSGIVGAHSLAIERQGLGVPLDAQIDDVLQDDLVEHEISW
jgi:hypothetical protein